MTLYPNQLDGCLSGDFETLYLEDIMLPSDGLRNCYDENKIREISESIKINGLLQSIIVRPKENHFEIVAGCRRYYACKMLGWKKIPCNVVELNDIQTFEISLIENIERISLSPVEEANAFKKYVCDKGWGSISQLSSKIGKSTSYIVKRIALLDLPLDILEKIRDSSLTPSTAEELFPISDPQKQTQLASLIVSKNIPLKRVREMVKDDPYYCKDQRSLDTRHDIRVLNTAIAALRSAMNNISSMIDDEYEDDGNGKYDNRNNQSNFVIRELLVYQSRLLHGQIDILIKAKKKYTKIRF